MTKYYLVGCGGIGGWLAHSLAKTLSKRDELVLIDGDKLEKKNLDRQLFSPDQIDQYKADAMRGALDGSRCKVTAVTEYLGEDNEFEFADRPGNWVIVGADNHPARKLALNMADRAGIRFLSAANGYEDAEAFFYMPEWKDTNLDPRVYYPEIKTSTVGDPLTPPCTGEILESAPQLAIANMSAASYAMWLLWFWREKFEKLPHDSEDVMDVVPYHVTSTSGRMRVLTLGTAKEAEDGDNS